MDVNKTRKDIRNAIKALRIDKSLHEDAMQEGFVAVLEGKNPMTHLSKWSRKENSFRSKLGLTSDVSIEDPSNQDNRVNHRIDDVKPKI